MPNTMVHSLKILLNKLKTKPKIQVQAFWASNDKLLSRSICVACRQLSNQAGGGVLHPDNVCTKSGRPVIEVLELKHLSLQNPCVLDTPDGVFEPYISVPTKLPIKIIQNVIEAYIDPSIIHILHSALYMPKKGRRDLKKRKKRTAPLLTFRLVSLSSRAFRMLN